MPSPLDERGISELVGDAVNQFTKLIRNEMAIAQSRAIRESHRSGDGCRA